MISKVLVVVPHQDDEINLVGTIIEQFIDSKIQVDLIFVTNGDFFPNETERRIRETKRVTKMMGFSNVFFLGYGDGAVKKREHLYQNSDFHLFCSNAGHTQTYGVGQYDDFRYSVSGYHSEYKISNLEKDMKECIQKVNADMIICVDIDPHPDHRMTSQVFEKVCCELIRDDYKPIILKKFAYAGVWLGKHDYYNEPMIETLLTKSEYYPYDLSQEIRVKVSEQIYPVFYWKSKVYKWCRCYQTQKANLKFWNIVNADAQYFYRDTNNLAISAEVQVSSGQGKYINDFKLYDNDTVLGAIQPTPDIIKKYTWIPDQNDSQKEILFIFPSPKKLMMLKMHQSHDIESRVVSIKLELDDGYEKSIRLPEKQSTTITLGGNIETRRLRIKILESIGTLAGFSEIEVFDHISKFPWEETPLIPFVKENCATRRYGARVMQRIRELHVFVTHDLHDYGIWYFICRLSGKIFKTNKLNCI